MVEFALVLPILLFITVGTIYYGFVFVIEVAIENAARQGAVAAASVAPTNYSTQEQFKAAIRVVVDQVAEDNLDWLPTSVLAGFAGGTIGNAVDICFPNDDCEAPESICDDLVATGDGQVGCVYITFALTGTSSPVLPQINLPPLGALPPLPANLSGVAEVVL